MIKTGAPQWVWEKTITANLPKSVHAKGFQPFIIWLAKKPYQIDTTSLACRQDMESMVSAVGRTWRDILDVMQFEAGTQFDERGLLLQESRLTLKDERVLEVALRNLIDELCLHN